MTTRVEADLDFSVTVGELRMDGVLRGSGSDLSLHVSDPTLLGGSGPEMAQVLAAAAKALGE